MIRVVVVDDQPLVRAGITMLVDAEKDIAVVAEAANGQDGLIQVRSERPDVVLMDVRMPVTDGVATTRTLIDENLTAQSGEPVRVIMLTTFHLDEYVHAALRAGASGFLLKDAPPTEIAAAIRAVVAGEAWLTPAVTRRFIDDFVTQPDPGRPTPAEIDQLTPREREVLTLLARGLSNVDVAKQLSVNEATVRTYVAHIITKLRVREKAQAVAAAYQAGLVQPRSSD